MAKLEQFLAAIENPRLREQLIREVKDLKDRTRFGLVYERQAPNSSPVPPILMAQDAGSAFADPASR